MTQIKRMRSLGVPVVLAVALVFCVSNRASGDGFSVSITVDENCNGTLTNTAGFFSPLPCVFQNDPGPGGLANVMTYDTLNPPALTAGDVLVFDNGVFEDVLRFNPTETVGNDTGALVVYSNPQDGFDSGGDTLSPPGAFYTNILNLNEIQFAGGGDGLIYTPTAGQPGFVAGASGPVTYTFTSDVPEPATLALLVSGLIGLAGVMKKRRASA